MGPEVDSLTSGRANECACVMSVCEVVCVEIFLIYLVVFFGEDKL